MLDIFELSPLTEDDLELIDKGIEEEEAMCSCVAYLLWEEHKLEIIEKLNENLKNVNLKA